MTAHNDRQISLQQLNLAAPEWFVARLGGIYEHSPWVAERVCGLRPFASTAALHAAMCAAVAAASEDEQLQLIRAHPQLASRAAIRGELTESSNREQSGAGLTQCSEQEFALLTRLNADYQQRFGFPFIIAVRGHDRSSIIAAMQARLQREYAAERAEALQQIGRIGEFRLAELVAAASV